MQYASVCVCSGSLLLRDLLGVSRSADHDYLSVLSIYHRIFRSVFILFFFLLGISYCVMYSIICSCVLEVFGLVVCTC